MFGGEEYVLRVGNEEFRIAETDPSRKSGFPQMEVINDQLFFAWTEILEGGTKVRVNSMKL